VTESNEKKRFLPEFADDLQATGRYTFDRAEALTSLRTSPIMLKKAVMRLVSKGRLVVPKRGFYIIVPIEYRAAGSPPPSWFIDDLMRRLGKPYYVGVLSAASLHGAAHQQPQEFQVVTKLAARPMAVGRSRIKLLGKSHFERSSMMQIKTETGNMQVSTPETTALDLIRYAPSAGGLGNVATVLSELAEQLDPVKLAEAARTEGEVVYAQRLGFLLDLVGTHEKAEDLAKFVSSVSPRAMPLCAGKPVKGSLFDKQWHLRINEQVEVDQ
jgi:predicted transcriptional regulator of viral defense system